MRSALERVSQSGIKCPYFMREGKSLSGGGGGEGGVGEVYCVRPSIKVKRTHANE